MSRAMSERGVASQRAFVSAHGGFFTPLVRWCDVSEHGALLC